MSQSGLESFGAYQKARQLFDLVVTDMETLKTNWRLHRRDAKDAEERAFDKHYSELCGLCMTIVQSLRSLHKFSGHCSYVAVLNEKIRPHHEAHEGHEGFRIFQTPNFVIFVLLSFKVFAARANFPITIQTSRLKREFLPRRRGVRREKNFIKKTPNSATSVPLR